MHIREKINHGKKEIIKEAVIEYICRIFGGESVIVQKKTCGKNRKR